MTGGLLAASLVLAGCSVVPSTKTQSSPLTRTVTRGHVTVTLSIATNHVIAGGSIPATLTISNGSSRTIFVPSCPVNGLFQVGIASRAIPFSPANGLVGCGTPIRSHHAFVQHEAISSSYQGCGGPPQPYCLPGRSPIPPLPPGAYRTAVEWQQVPVSIPMPGSMRVTVLPENPRRALLLQQAQWPQHVKLGYFGDYWGSRHPGRVIPDAKWRRTELGTTCAGSTCWSLTLVGDQVFALRRSSGGGPWRIGSPVLMGAAAGSWLHIGNHQPGPMLELLGSHTVVVLTPNQIYLSPDAGSKWYVGSQFGSVVSVTGRGEPVDPAPVLELTAAASAGSNAVRVYQSTDGVHWTVAPSRVLPDLASMRPDGVVLLLSSLHLRAKVHQMTYCGGPPHRMWPYGTIWFQQPQPYAAIVRGSLVTVDVGRNTDCLTAVP